MTPPILYTTLASPPCRSVLLTAKAIGVDLELREIDLQKREHMTPEFIKLNPQHTIPTLDDNGTIVYDSHAICTYLCDKYSEENEQYYPKDLARRALVDSRLHFDSCVLFARLRFLFEPIIFMGESEISTFKVENIQKAWPIMEAFLENTQYVCGHSMTIADFCCAATITSLDEVAPIDPTTYPKLTAWLERMEFFPDYEDLNTKGAILLKEKFAKCLKLNQEKAKKN